MKRNRILHTGALVAFLVAFADAAYSATVPFTFTITGEGTTDALPSPANPTVGLTLTATGSFSPFGEVAFSQISRGYGKLLITFQPAGDMEAHFHEVAKFTKQPTQNELQQMFSRHGMQLLGPPLAN